VAELAAVGGIVAQVPLAEALEVPATGVGGFAEEAFE
jgi:hypothetical protein